MLQVLIGCDGVHSFVARKLGLAEPVKSGRSAVRGMAVFPEGHGMGDEVQQFVDVGIRAGMVPLNDKEIYWFLTFKSTPKGRFCHRHNFMPLSLSKIQLITVLKDIVAVPGPVTFLGFAGDFLFMT